MEGDVSLNVEIKFSEDCVIYHDEDGNEVYGDKIEFNIMGQKFSRIWQITETKKDVMYRPETKYLKAGLLGEALMKIGYDITMQATYGSDSTTVLEGGKKIISF